MPGLTPWTSQPTVRDGWKHSSHPSRKTQPHSLKRKRGGSSANANWARVQGQTTSLAECLSPALGNCHPSFTGYSVNPTTPLQSPLSGKLPPSSPYPRSPAPQNTTTTDPLPSHASWWSVWRSWLSKPSCHLPPHNWTLSKSPTRPGGKRRMPSATCSTPRSSTLIHKDTLPESSSLTSALFSAPYSGTWWSRSSTTSTYPSSSFTSYTTSSATDLKRYGLAQLHHPHLPPTPEHRKAVYWAPSSTHSTPDMGKLWPAGHIRPAACLCPARVKPVINQPPQWNFART